MCGIAGILYKENRKPNKQEIKQMTDIIYHRGPDNEGYYLGSNFASGHRRLAILDLSGDINLWNIKVKEGICYCP